MSLYDLLSPDSTLGPLFLLTGAIVWAAVIGLAFIFAFAGAVKVIYSLVVAWLSEDPERHRLPWRAM